MSRIELLAIRFIGASPIVWFIAFFLFHFLVLAPSTAPLQEVVGSEISIITPPLQAQLQETGTSLKTDQASVYYRYAIPLSHSEVFNYYDIELNKHGWSFVSQHDITTAAIGRDYCKENYSLSLDYYDIGYTWKYELWLTAGESSDCARKKGGSFLSITEAFFLLGCSTTWGLFALILAQASWRMPKDEFVQFINKVIRMPTGIWSMRLNTVVIFVISSLGFLFGLYTIAMYALSQGAG